MLISVIGKNFSKKSAKLKAILADLKQKRPQANFFHYDFLDLNQEKIAEIINTTGGLFESKDIYLLSNIFYKKEIKNIFFENLVNFQNSENAFLLSLDKLPATDLKEIKKYSFSFYDFSEAENKFDIFSLATSLQIKDKKKLWLNFHLALKNNLNIEVIYNNLFFALKTLTLVEKFSLAESGLKNYPYQKAQQALKKWKKGEAEKKFLDLILVHNRSRQKGLTLVDALEKFILEL